jgi:hypothetical protein
LLHSNHSFGMVSWMLLHEPSPLKNRQLQACRQTLFLLSRPECTPNHLTGKHMGWREHLERSVRPVFLASGARYSRNLLPQMQTSHVNQQSLQKFHGKHVLAKIKLFLPCRVSKGLDAEKKPGLHTGFNVNRFDPTIVDLFALSTRSASEIADRQTNVHCSSYCTIFNFT